MTQLQRDTRVSVFSQRKQHPDLVYPLILHRGLNVYLQSSTCAALECTEKRVSVSPSHDQNYTTTRTNWQRLGLSLIPYISTVHEARPLLIATRRKLAIERRTKKEKEKRERCTVLPVLTPVLGTKSSCCNVLEVEEEINIPISTS